MRMIPLASSRLSSRCLSSTRLSSRRLDSRRGFTLIEVLIAILVLAVGLLGLAGLQVVSLKTNHNAYLRSQATYLAHDAIERMRANRVAALSGSYDIGYSETASGASVAKNDLADWKTRLARELPGGDGAITVSASRLALVQIRWDDARGDDSGENAASGGLLEFRVTTGL